MSRLREESEARYPSHHEIIAKNETDREPAIIMIASRLPAEECPQNAKETDVYKILLIASRVTGRVKRGKL